MAALDNRNKDIANDPEINKVLDEKVPETEPEAKKDPELEKDLIDPKDRTIDDTDTDIDDKADESIEEEEAKEEEKPVKKKPQEIKQNIEDRYKESSKEAMILFSKNKKLNDTIEEAANLPEPTDSELRDYAKLNDAVYDDLDVFTQNILKKTLMNERRFQKIDESRNESKQLDKWVTEVDDYINSPEVINDFPVISDNADEFRSYALKQGHRGIGFDILSASFLYQLSKAPKERKKGSILLSGGNSKAGASAPKEYTAADAKHLRETDPRKYKKFIREGKINFDI